MKHIFSNTILSLLVTLLAGPVFAQMTIDQIHTDSMALAFVKEQNYSKTNAPQWKFFYLTTGQEWKSYFNFTKQRQSDIEKQMNSLRWEKADINGDNKADLIVSGYIARKPGDWTTATFKLLVFLSQSGKGFHQYNLLTEKSEKYPAYFDRIRLDDNDYIRLFRWQLTQQPSHQSYQLDTLAYDSYWGSFVNAHTQKPEMKPIKSIVYKAQDDPDGSFHQLLIDRSTDKKINVVVSTWQSGDKTIKGNDTTTSKARLTQNLKEHLDSLCWRISPGSGQTGKPTILNHELNSQDLPVFLTVHYTDGTKTEIIDYGGEGSYTLMTIYGALENIIQNVFQQLEQRQRLMQTLTNDVFGY